MINFESKEKISFPKDFMCVLVWGLTHASICEGQKRGMGPFKQEL